MTYVRRRAFTLIELMVVVGIIGLLMGLLIPNMAAARERSRAMVCATNLKTIHVMTLMYTNDNNSYYMFGISGSCGYHPGNMVSWDNLLATYDGREEARNSSVFAYPYADFPAGINPRKPGGAGRVAKLYVCPSDGDFLRDPTMVTNGSYYTRTYGINSHYGDMLGIAQSISGLGGLATVSNSYTGMPGSLRTTSVDNPSTTLEFASFPQQHNVLGDLGTSFVDRPANFNGRAIYTDNNSLLSDASGGMTGLHGGYLDNILYCDGHVEYTDFRMTAGSKGIAYGATGSVGGAVSTTTYLSSPSFWARDNNMRLYAHGAWTRDGGD